MRRFIAVCSDIYEFKNNRIMDKEWAKKFPGALWVSCLAELAEKESVQVVTGDIAIANVLNGTWKAEEVAIIQELDAKDGKNFWKWEQYL